MKIIRVKRKCGVRGCKEKVSFAVSRTGEMGNSVIICRKCLEEALREVKKFKEPEKTKSGTAPGLFYNTPIVGNVKEEKVAEEIAGTAGEMAETKPRRGRKKKEAGE